MKKSIVLLSGGLDSAVNLAHALRESKVELCLTFDYNQRAAKQEIKHAKALSEHFGVYHKVVKLDFFNCLNNSALLNESIEIPQLEEEQLDHIETTKKTAKTVWVPNRNGIFINIAAGFAENAGCDIIVVGFNAEEAATFPDNSEDYLRAVNKALEYSSLSGVKVVSYTQRLNKLEIVELGKRLNVPWKYIWSCYYGGEEMCGECESCRRYFRSLKKSRVEI